MVMNILRFQMLQYQLLHQESNATAVAITTSVNNVYSVKNINYKCWFWIYCCTNFRLVSAASTIAGIGSTYYGVGAAATASIVTDGVGIYCKYYNYWCWI